VNSPVPDRAGDGRPDSLPRLFSAAALLVSVVGLVMAMTGMAASQGKPRPHGPVYLNAKGKLPLSVLPTVPTAKNARALGGAGRQKLSVSCPVSGAVDMGSWCLEGSTYKVPTADVGKNNYAYATQKCVEEGGWLPTAAQLIGSAPKAALKSTADDDPGTSGASEFPEARNGIKDEREMTADLFTTTAGAAAAGSEGVSEAARGATATGEPDPLPAPADPFPNSLDYVTVFDNHNSGGFAGGRPVSEPENFRCAYAKGYQGKPRDISSRS
jgi:hypothetical protein